MYQQSVFHEEWLRSLREQYKHVVRNEDHLTLSSLTAVMHNVGFAEAELAQLRIEATMHVDDVGEDFSADMNILNKVEVAQPHPAECICPQCMIVDESGFDAEGQPITPDPEENTGETGHVFPVATSGEINDRAETEPFTFEDSVAEESQTDDQESESPADEDVNEADNDPAAPQQMSLF